MKAECVGHRFGELITHSERFLVHLCVISDSAGGTAEGGSAGFVHDSNGANLISDSVICCLHNSKQQIY